jgi:hypothetical protein
MATPVNTPLTGPAPIAPEPDQQAAGQQEPAEGSDQYVTKAELDAALLQNQRLAQSLVDKAQANTQKRISEALANVDRTAALAKDAGTPIPDAQLKAMKDLAREKVLNDPDQNTGQQGGQQQQQLPPGADVVAAEVQAKQVQAGIFLEQNDPELQTIIVDQGLSIYFKSIDEALATKAARLASPQPNQSAALNTAGRTVVRGSPPNPNRIANITDSAQLYEMGEQEIRSGKARKR